MACADLLKQLFRAYRESFMDVASSIADEERKKRHPTPVNELFRQGVRPTRHRRQMGGVFSG